VRIEGSGAHLLGSACGPQGRPGGVLACRLQYCILQKWWHMAWGTGARHRDLAWSWGLGHLPEDRHAGAGPGGGAGAQASIRRRPLPAWHPTSGRRSLSPITPCVPPA